MTKTTLLLLSRALSFLNIRNWSHVPNHMLTWNGHFCKQAPFIVLIF